MLFLEGVAAALDAALSVATVAVIAKLLLKSWTVRCRSLCQRTAVPMSMACMATVFDTSFGRRE